MIVVGWSNGSPNSITGAGYGIRMTRKDRDKYFLKEYPSVIIKLNEESQVEVKLSDSFWRRCTELRSARIGRWMIKQGIAPWRKGDPPKLKLEQIEDRTFRLIGYDPI